MPGGSCQIGCHGKAWHLGSDNTVLNPSSAASCVTLNKLLLHLSFFICKKGDILDYLKTLNERLLWYITVSFYSPTLLPSQWLSAPGLPRCPGLILCVDLNCGLGSQRDTRMKRWLLEQNLPPSKRYLCGEVTAGTPGVWEESSHVGNTHIWHPVAEEWRSAPK